MFSEPRHRDSDDEEGEQEEEDGSGCSDVGSDAPTRPSAALRAPAPSASPPPPPPSLSETLSRILAGLKRGQGLLETVMSSMYANIEAQLKTTVGLEFIRTRQALQDNLLLMSTTQSALLSQQQQVALPYLLADQSPKEKDYQLQQQLLVPFLQQQRKEMRPSWLERSWRACREEGGGYAISAVLDGIKQQPLAGPLFPCVEMRLSKQAGLASPSESEEDEDEAAQDDSAAAAFAASTRLYFGDVHVKTTLRRCWGVLSVRQKLGFVWSLLAGSLTNDITEKDLENLLKVSR